MFLLLEDKNISSSERTCWRRVELRGRSTSGVFFFNGAGLFKAIEIWKAAGNKWSNHWEVLKSALLRATPPQLISRRSRMLGVPQQHGGRQPLLFFSPTRVMKRQFWTQCYIYEKGWKFPAKGCMPECGASPQGILISFLPHPSSLLLRHHTRIPPGEQMSPFLWAVRHRAASHANLETQPLRLFGRCEEAWVKRSKERLICSPGRQTTWTHGETVVSADCGRRKCMCFHGPEHAPGLVCMTAARGIQSCGTEPGFGGSSWGHSWPSPGSPS